MGLRRARLVPILFSGARAGVTYLLRDEFATADDAPITSPRTCEPGPGVLTATQTDGTMAIADGKLAFTAQTTPNYGRQGFYGSAQTRAEGLALFGTVNISATSGFKRLLFMWAKTTSINYTDISGAALLTAEASFRVITAAADLLPVGAYAVSTDYRIAIVLHATGNDIFVKGGAYTFWTRLWVSITGADATVYPVFTNLENTGTLDDFTVRQLPAPFNAPYGTATLHVAAPESGTAYTGTADALTDLTVTAPAVLDGQATTRCGFYYRTDADLTPAWHIYVDGTGAFNLDYILADGTRTNAVAVAGVIAGGQTRTLRSIHVGTLHNLYTYAGASPTSRGTFTGALNQTVTRIIPSAPAGWTIANLDDWPVTVPAAQATELDKT